MKRPLGFTSDAAADDETRWLGHVLDHLHRAHDVEAPRLCRKLFDRGNAIVEFRARLLSMAARRVDRGGRRIDGRDVRPEPRERFGEEPRPAADVEEIEARKRRAG